MFFFLPGQESFLNPVKVGTCLWENQLSFSCLEVVLYLRDCHYYRLFAIYSYRDLVIAIAISD